MIKLIPFAPEALSCAEMKCVRSRDGMARKVVERVRDADTASGPMMLPRRSSRVPAAQSGVGLIEVLVAVLVLSIGFLGIAALQATSLSTNNSAMARSMATIASYSIMDAMRADIVSAKAGNYTTTVTADSCPTTTGSLAQSQLGQWCGELGHGLGALASTSGQIICSGAGECTVTISFDDSRAGKGGSTNQQVITKGIL